MEVRKVLRKATAIAASASFIGATMLGAVAQDLKDYPAPFVSNGVFDAFIVVGADAQPADVIGAVDVGSSLQFALKKATTVSAGAAAATIDQGVKVEKSGNKFNYEDSITSVENAASLSSDDLPTTLGDGKYVESEGANKNSETYTQRLLFNNTGTAKLHYEQDDDTAPKAGDYLHLDKGKELYNYTLEFDSSVEYDNSSSTTANDDLKTSTLTIQGQTYTVTDVELEGGAINKLTLLSGEAVLWLTQNNPITKTVSGVEHTVEVLDVTENADACQVKVDDQTAIIDVDETKVISGVQIGITDVRAIHAQLQDVDVCQISIGASELTIENGKKIKVDDVKLDGSRGSIADDGGQLNSIEVTYDGSDLDDDVELAAGKEFIDPIFKSWKVVYGGLSADYETYHVKRKGASDAEFVFNNNNGKSVSVPLFLNDSNAVVNFGEGDDVSDLVLAKGTGINGLLNTCAPSSNDVLDCKRVKILAATAGGEAHMFEVTNIDLEDNQTDIEDLTTGRTFSDVDFTQGVDSSLPLGSFGAITLNIDASQLTVNNSVLAKIETGASGSVEFSFDGVNSTIGVSELDRNGNTDIPDELPASNVSVVLRPDNSNEEIDITSSLQVPTGFTSYNVDLEPSSDFNVLVTPVGTKVTDNTENDDSVVIEQPKAEVYGNVFVAPIVAQVSTAAGGVPTYTLTKLNVGAAKLDSEISDVGANNLITVGGPCANKVTAQVLGKTFPACGADSGIAAGTALIKAVKQSSGKVALVVAGYDAIDTRRATRVLANYDQFDLSGSEVVVTGTSLTDIQVKKSA